MITVIDYGLGNLASVGNALRKLGVPFEVTGKAADVRRAEALILPGVGAAGKGMENLKKKKLDTVIKEKVNEGTPFLGICLGMQLMLRTSEEGDVKCLGLVEGKVKRFKTKLKVPEIGWNMVGFRIPDSGYQIPDTGVQRFYKDINHNSYFYFVNSYFCEPEDDSAVAGVTDYDGDFCSVIVKDNLYGVQFHPEKSGDVGLQMLKNFTDLAGTVCDG